MLKVYLDSQDYSVLSNKNLTSELTQIKEKLLDFARSGRVSFFFSDVVVCEAAPTQSNAVSYAIDRGDLIAMLCGRNALLDNASLLHAEVLRLQCLDEHGSSPYRLDGTWFPKFEIDPLPDFESSVLDGVMDAVATHAKDNNFSRQQRRALERKLLKNGKIRPKMRSGIEETSMGPVAQEAFKKYPMDTESMESIVRYGMGKGNSEEAEAAFGNSFRDLGLFMRWFNDNTALAVPIAETIRKPGRLMADNSKKYIQEFFNLRSEIENSEFPINKKELLANIKLENLQDTMTVNITNKIIISKGLKNDRDITAEDIAKNCPGLDALIRSMASSIWDNIGGSRKELPSDSQFPDAVHAIYGPYVDIFRADTFMAPHIRKQLHRHGTTVVSKLSQLPAVIEQRLN